MKAIALFVILISLSYVAKSADVSPTHFKKYELHIANGIYKEKKGLAEDKKGKEEKEELVSVHCWSKDMEIGTHPLKPKGDFYFKFHMLMVKEVKCNIVWKEKSSSINVFDKEIAKKHCGKDKISICYWLVKEDGLYLGDKVNPGEGDVKKMYPWD